MSRFKKFIDNERKNEHRRNNEKKQGNSFKRKRRGKRIYKTQQNKDTFMKNMETNKGATIQQYNILSAIKKKPEKNKKIKKEKKIDNEFLNDKTVVNQDEKEFMKRYIVDYYENQCDEEDEDEIITDTSLKKTDNIISF